MTNNTTTTPAEAICLPDELPEQMIEELRECDDPAYELHCAIGDLECLVRDLKVLEREFSSLAEDAPDEVHRDWEDNPRYVLPLRKAGEETKANANDMQKHLRELTGVVLRLSREGKI